MTPPAARMFVETFDTAASKTAVSLYGSAHSNRDQPNLYEELVRFYDHFGLKREPSAELPDHLSVELEFMHFLSFSEAQCPDHEGRQALQRAQADFLDRHLLPLCRAVSDGLGIAAGPLHRLVQAVCTVVADHRTVLESTLPKV